MWPKIFNKILSYICEIILYIGLFNKVSTVRKTWTYVLSIITGGTAVAQWLRCCATNRKVAGSIPAGVSRSFIHMKSFRSHYGPGVDSASNRNEYQEYFLGVKAAGA